MPDTTWPVSGYPPGSSRSRRNTPVSMSSKRFGTSATIRSRSPSRSPPDASAGAFSSSLTTTVFSQRSMRRLEASLRRATPKGHETFISRTAPHQGLAPTSGPPCVQDTLRHPQHPQRYIRAGQRLRASVSVLPDPDRLRYFPAVLPRVPGRSPRTLRYLRPSAFLLPATPVLVPHWLGRARPGVTGTWRYGRSSAMSGAGRGLLGVPTGSAGADSAVSGAERTGCAGSG